MLIVHSELNGSGLSLYSSVLILGALILNWMNGASRINSQWDCWVIESLKKTHRETREVKSLSDCRSAAELHHLNLCVCSLKSECVWLFIYATPGCDWEISPVVHCWPTECSDIMLDKFDLTCFISSLFQILVLVLWHSPLSGSAYVSSSNSCDKPTVRL